MGQLTTHVLDTAAGVPAAGVRIDVHELPNVGEPALLLSVMTGNDGRCGGPLIAGDRFRVGRYSLTYHLGEYFRGRGVNMPAPAFIEDAVVRIGIADAADHYHVPLLASPWSYTVYRGG